MASKVDSGKAILKMRWKNDRIQIPQVGAEMEEKCEKTITMQVEAVCTIRQGSLSSIQLGVC